MQKYNIRKIRIRNYRIFNILKPDPKPENFAKSGKSQSGIRFRVHLCFVLTRQSNFLTVTKKKLPQHKQKVTISINKVTMKKINQGRNTFTLIQMLA